MAKNRHGKYPVGTVLRYRNGCAFVKGKDGKWVRQSRLVYSLQFGELQEGQRVFHKDGDRTNDEAENLVAIQFNEFRFQLFPERKVLYMPKKEVAPKTKRLVIR